MSSPAFTWGNFISLKSGSLIEKRTFHSIIIILICQLIFIVNWGISWRASGYLTTTGAILSFFIHFFGFYTLWNKNPFGQLLYIIVLFCLSILYVASAVLSILSITLNTQQATQGSDQITPLVTFQLYGVVGDSVADIPFFVVLVVINLAVFFLTFVLVALVIQIRNLILKEKHSSSLGLRPISREPSRKNSSAVVVDFNIPGSIKPHQTAQINQISLPSHNSNLELNNVGIHYQNLNEKNTNIQNPSNAHHQGTDGENGADTERLNIG